MIEIMQPPCDGLPCPSTVGLQWLYDGGGGVKGRERGRGRGKIACSIQSSSKKDKALLSIGWIDKLELELEL